jgi:hypothetical protein
MQRQTTHVFILQPDIQYSRGFPDALPLPANFLPENDFFTPKEAVVDWYFYTPEGMMSSIEHLPLENNQLQLKKWLSKKSFDYEYDDRGRKIRGKKFADISKIRLKIERVICERVKQKRSRRKTPIIET